MPSSDYRTIPFMLENALRLQPASVLDVGAGFGKYGLLLREYLEGWHDRVFPSQWRVTIHAVEVFTRYTSELPWYGSVYNAIFPMSIQDALHGPLQNRRYDLAILGDVIEHLPKGEAITTLSALADRVNKAILLAVPLGEGWLGNVAVAGNDAERHQSSWEESEILSVFPAVFHRAQKQIVAARRGNILAACLEKT